MNNKLQKISLLVTLTALFLLGNFELASALPPPPPPPPPGGGGPPCWPPPCIPINKGLVFLAIASFILAAYKLKIFRSSLKSKES